MTRLQIEFTNAAALIQKLTNNIELVIEDNQSAVEHLLISLFAGGHVLLEDLPGTGKTTLAKALAKSINADFKRLQFTPDLLPSDILGVSIYKQQSQEFEFRPGPIFTEILLADEINRASPRAQSALLEAMSENQVSIEGEERLLPNLFFVIATQNPIEFHGTYPLPEAQLDRFAMKFRLGYLPAKQEVALLGNELNPVNTLSPVLSSQDICNIKLTAQKVNVSEEVKYYLVELIAATRRHEKIQMGASARASLMLMKCAQVKALMRGETYVKPQLIQQLFPSVVCHRIVLHNDASFSGTTEAQVLEEILQQITVPV